MDRLYAWATENGSIHTNRASVAFLTHQTLILSIIARDKFGHILTWNRISLPFFMIPPAKKKYNTITTFSWEKLIKEPKTTRRKIKVAWAAVVPSRAACSSNLSSETCIKPSLTPRQNEVTDGWVKNNTGTGTTLDTIQDVRCSRNSPSVPSKL